MKWIKGVTRMRMIDSEGGGAFRYLFLFFQDVLIYSLSRRRFS